MSSTLVRGVVAVTGSALALSLGLVAPSAYAAPIPAPVGADPAPVAAGAAYLAAQPNADGFIVSYFGGAGSVYPGITIDAATSLAAVGGQDAAFQKMAAAVEASNYSTTNPPSAAKFAAFEYNTGRSGAGLAAAVDLVEANVNPSGRLTSPSYTSPIDQVSAVSALHDAGSSSADSALDFLLTQQCADGSFRGDYSFVDPDESCDDADPAEQGANVDTTAWAVLQLQDQRSDSDVAASLTKAAAWLVGHQAPSGSFNGYGDVPNGNSTGLAAWALGVSNRTDAAGRAALWLRQHQLANAGSCVTFAPKDVGAIMQDDLGLATAKTGPLDPDDNSTAAYVTAQALPGLLWAPGGAAAGDTKLTGPTDFVPAGSGQTVTVAGAPGNTLCVTVGSSSTRVALPASGTTTVPVTLPPTTGSVVVSTVDAGGETDSLTLKGLAAAKLKGKAPKQVELGEKFKVKIAGLQPGETVVVKYRGTKKTLTANAKGVVKPKLKAKKLGTSKVKFTGEFGDRKGKVTVTVVP